MAVCFARAPEVRAGDCVTARQWNQFAAALNSRLRSGVGDPTWRIWWRAASLVRQPCSNTETAVTPADAWLRWFLAADDPHELGCPTSDNAIWPLAVLARGLQDPFGLADESERMPTPCPTDATPGQAWQAAAQQRGAITPDGSGVAPALAAAAAVDRIRYTPYVTPLLKSWGGYQQSARTGAEYFADSDNLDWWIAWLAWERRCLRTGEPGQQHADAWAYEPIIYEFHPVRPGLVPLIFEPVPLVDYQYDPTHGCYVYNLETDRNRDRFLENVASVTYGADRYILRRLNGQTIDLLYSDYVEGPYGHPARLKHTHSTALRELMQWYADEMQGTPEQRQGAPSDASARAWDWEAFFGSQYLLAPAYGVRSGQQIEAVYPRWTGTAPLSDGMLLELQEGGTGTDYAVHDGYVPAGVYVSAAGLLTSATVALERADTGEELVRLSVSASEPEVIRYVSDPPAGVLVRVRVVRAGQWAENGSLAVELAELVRYRPSVADAYVVLRGMTTRGEGGAPERIGSEMSNARELSDLWHRYGCIVADTQVPEQAAQPVSYHPLYREGHRMLRENLRMVDARWTDSPTLLSYEVGQDGKSVLRFKRWHQLDTEWVDLFRGIAPTDAPAEQIDSGVTYVVAGSSGAVMYMGETYEPGDTFIGGTESSYTRTGSAYPRPLDGIRPTAPPTGESNQWLMFCTQHAEKPTGWCTPENYGDIAVLLSDRCVTFDARLDPLGDSPDLAAQVGHNIGGLVAENPPGYRYARSTRSDGGALNAPSSGPGVNFLRSCRIYEPDYEVESVTLEGEGYDQIVAVKLSGRLRHTPAAPGTIPRDRAQWPRDANGQLVDGDGNPPAYRTDENAVMEMLLWLYDGVPARELVGDHSCNSTYTPGECYGSCITHFWFTRLIPTVYEEPEPNEVAEPHDTPASARRVLWAHWCIAAMCEGYIARSATRLQACPPTRLADYDYAELCRDVARRSQPLVVPHSSLGGALYWAAEGAAQWAVQVRDTESSRPEEWVTEAIVDGPPYHPQQTGERYDYRVVALTHARQYLWLLPPPSDVPGYGPLTNTVLYASVFDQLCAAVNLLDTVRLELPLTLTAQWGQTIEDRTDWSEGAYCRVDWPNPSAPLLIQRVGDGGEIGETALPTQWQAAPANTLGVARTAAPRLTDSGYPVRDGEGRWLFRVTESVMRFGVAENDWLEAVPETIRDMVRDRPTVVAYGWDHWSWLDPVGPDWRCPEGGNDWGCDLASYGEDARICVYLDPREGESYTYVRAPALRAGVMAVCTEPGIGGNASGPIAERSGSIAQTELVLRIPICDS